MCTPPHNHTNMVDVDQNQHQHQNHHHLLQVDWTQLDQQIDKELKDEPEGDPLWGLFRDIYSQADEDTRRAMNKSFQESKGTVLSTNWKEVGVGKVKVEGPEKKASLD